MSTKEEKEGSAALPRKMPTLPELVAARDQLVADLEAFEKLKESLEAQARAIGPHIDLDQRMSTKQRIKEVDVGCWEHVITLSGVVSSMTEKAKEDYLDKIRKEPPRFSLQELEGLILNAGRLYSEGFAQTIAEVRRTFLGCEYSSGDWRYRKKDNLQKIEHLFRCSYYSSKFEDLLTACYLMEKKKKPDYSNNYHSLANTRGQDGRKPNPVVTPYFKVQTYQNGNAKVNWNPDKLDVLERLNAWGKEQDLPDTMRKRYKRHHFHHGGYDPDAAAEVFDGGPDLQFFGTSPELAQMLIALAEVEPESRVLEPHLGEGGIYFELEKVVGREQIQGFEIDHERAEKMRAAGAILQERDFLKVRPREWKPFDRIVMNPPFHNSGDAVHVLHALRFLAPGGGLVSVMAAGIERRSGKTAGALRQAVAERRGRFEPIPDGAFKQAGTNVRTVALVIPPRRE